MRDARARQLRGLIVGFFKRNPDEELTRADLYKKFSTTDQTVLPVLTTLILEDVLRFEARGQAGQFVYFAGPRL